MTQRITLTLGTFVFARYEIPEHINFGGEQRLGIHELVGGVRVIDSLGAVSAPIEWSGVFVGNSAIDRALYLDTMRKVGKPVQLKWGKFLYLVVIKSFTPEYRLFSRIPYRIVCEVVRDLTSPVKNYTDPSKDQLMAEDLNKANGLAGSIGDGTLLGLMATLNSAISGVSSFAKATTSTLNSVLGPIAAVRRQVAILTQATNGVIRNVTTLGGIAPNNPIAQQVANLTQQINATTNSAKLLNLDRTLGRMSTNIGTINGGQKTVTQAGGNLFSVASTQYGSAAKWEPIAKANGLTDPMLTGVNKLTIPPNNA